MSGAVGEKFPYCLQASIYFNLHSQNNLRHCTRNPRIKTKIALSKANTKKYVVIKTQLLFVIVLATN